MRWIPATDGRQARIKGAPADPPTSGISYNIKARGMKQF